MTKRRTKRFYIKGKGSFAQKNIEKIDNSVLVLKTQNEEMTNDSPTTYRMSKD